MLPRRDPHSHYSTYSTQSLNESWKHFVDYLSQDEFHSKMVRTQVSYLLAMFLFNAFEINN